MRRFFLGVRGQGPGARGQGARVGKNLQIPLFGFTLTELLVVITIIGMLVGLLMPALIASRGRARVAQCTNNQKELGSAILQFEMAKQRFPGYANNVAGKKVSWIPVLFPYLGRMDLWEGANGWRTGNPSASMMPRISQLVCPDGSPGTITAAPDTPLSYVVNAYAYNGSQMAPEISVFRDLFTAPTSSITMSSIKSPSRRPMISERNYIIASTTDNLRSWSDMTTANVSAVRLGFVWPTSGIITGTTTISGVGATTILPAIHRGIVIVTFCDGHTESVADNIDCSVYDSTPVQ